MSESKTTTPRTDTKVFSIIFNGEIHHVVLADDARTLELELNEANSKLDTVLTDVNYVGGVQYWIEKYDNVMFEFIELRAQLTTAQQEIAELRNILNEIYKEHCATMREGQETGHSDGLWLTPSLSMSVREAINSAMKGTNPHE